MRRRTQRLRLHHPVAAGGPHPPLRGTARLAVPGSCGASLRPLAFARPLRCLRSAFLCPRQRQTASPPAGEGRASRGGGSQAKTADVQNRCSSARTRSAILSRGWEPSIFVTSRRGGEGLAVRGEIPAWVRGFSTVKIRHGVREGKTVNFRHIPPRRGRVRQDTAKFQRRCEGFRPSKTVTGQTPRLRSHPRCAAGSAPHRG